MIAGFIFLRLRGILGKRTGFEAAPTQLKVLKNVKIEKQEKKMIILTMKHKKNF